jgi:Tat protein translocase TatB subunit
VFGIGFPELLMILVIALMVIGPRRLPDIAKALGRALGEFKRATDEFKQSIAEETRAIDIREQIIKGGKIHPPTANRPATANPAAEADAQENNLDVNPKPAPNDPPASSAEQASRPVSNAEDSSQQPGTDDHHDG